MSVAAVARPGLRARIGRIAASEASAIVGLGFLLAVPHFFYHDLAYQLDDGRRLWSGEFPRSVPMAIAAGPLVDHEWLFEALAWPFWSHGIFPVFAMLCAFAVAVTPLFASAIARRCGATPWTANAVGYLSIAGLGTSYAVRPQTFAVMAFAATLLFALAPADDKIRAPVPWPLLAITCVWANLHGSAVFAAPLVALVAAGRLIAGEPAVGRRRLALGVVAAGAGTLLTPLGLSLYGGAAQYTSAVLKTTDWLPVSLSYPIAFFVVVAYGFVLIAGGVPVTRANATALLTLGPFGILWLEYSRFLPFFTIAAVPALVAALGADGARQGRRRRRARRAGRAPERPLSPLALGLPVALVIVAVAIAFGPASVRPIPSLVATETLVHASGFVGPLYVPYEAAAYLELEREPVRVLLDSHATPYGDAAWADFERVDGARPGWQETLNRRGISGAIARDDSALGASLAANAAWSRCRRSDGFTLYARNDAASGRIGTLRCLPWH